MSAHAPSKPRPVEQAQSRGEKVARSSGFEWLSRAGFVARGLIYGIIGILAIKLALGAGGNSSGNPDKTTGGVFGWPGGTWLVGIAGAILVGVGLYQGYRGISKDFLEDSKTEEMSPTVRTWFEWIDGALAKLAHNSYGPFLLGIVAAAGLVAFGIYSLTDARYRQI